MVKTLTLVRTALLLSMLLLGISVASASEVTGTLSSGIGGTTGSSSSQASGTLGSDVGGGGGSLGGTVTDGSGSNGGGGGSSSGGGNSSGNSSGGGRNQSGGSVLGASDTQGVSSPSFPNAGYRPDEETKPWATAMIGLTLFTLLALTFGHYTTRRP